MNLNTISLPSFQEHLKIGGSPQGKDKRIPYLLNKIQKPGLAEINHWLQFRLVRTRQPEPDQI
jgi:hypothetical protein